MLALVSDGISTVIGWIGSVVGALVGEAGELSVLAPLFVISISISAIMLGIRLCKSLIWGA